MKTRCQVTNSKQNQVNCPEMIGKIVDDPPSFCTVKPIRELRPMSEIFKNQSPMFAENDIEHMADDFIVKCVREGYDKEEVVRGLGEFYSQSPEAGKAMFDRVLIKFLKLDPDPKKFNLMEFRNKERVARINNGIALVKNS